MKLEQDTRRCGSLIEVMLTEGRCVECKLDRHVYIVSGVHWWGLGGLLTLRVRT